MNKKIISFSLWGSDPKYTKPALINIKLAQKYYHGWTCVFYYDETVPDNIIEEIQAEGGETILMPKSDGNYGMFWRFLPLDRTDVDMFIVRDLDSRISPREADAVQEWIESGKSFHTMRDNKWHNVVPICGGMWGCKPQEIKFDFSNELNKWINNNGHRILMHPRGKFFFADQSFLGDVLWPLVINKSLAHESIPSNYGGLKKDFRIKNEDGTFIGQPFE